METNRSAGARELEAARDRLIVALDFPAAAPALDLAARLRGQCRWVKVGMELFYAEGRDLLARLRDLDFQIFLDLKLHDIPSTVAAAVRSAGGTGTSLLTVHASGGATMLEAARDAAAGMTQPPGLIAVTVLTSMDAGQLRSVGVDDAVAAQVLRLARLAVDCGMRGLVCSPLEAEMLRLELGAGPELVVPGIRPPGADLADQARVATPAVAIQAGASRIVVGRPITRAVDPEAATGAILDEIAHAIANPSQIF